MENGAGDSLGLTTAQVNLLAAQGGDGQTVWTVWTQEMLIGKSYSVTVMSREECIRVCHPISEFLCFVWGRLNRKARFESLYIKLKQGKGLPAQFFGQTFLSVLFFGCFFFL